MEQVMTGAEILTDKSFQQETETMMGLIRFMYAVTNMVEDGGTTGVAGLTLTPSTIRH